MTPRCAALVAASVAVLASCTDPNAVLEVSLDLPPRPADVPPGEEVYAFVQFRGAEVALDDAWPADQRDYPGRALGPARQTVSFSLISETDDLAVHTKVRFCRGLGDDAARCVADDERSSDARALWFAIERPFHLGERTRWTHAIAAVPTSPPTIDGVTAVGKCEIEGCVDAVDASSFCRADGAHFCE